MAAAASPVKRSSIAFPISRSRSSNCSAAASTSSSSRTSRCPIISVSRLTTTGTGPRPIDVSRTWSRNVWSKRRSPAAARPIRTKSSRPLPHAAPSARMPPIGSSARCARPPRPWCSSASPARCSRASSPARRQKERGLACGIRLSKASSTCGGGSVQVGDRLRVKLTRVDPPKGFIDFVRLLEKTHRLPQPVENPGLWRAQPPIRHSKPAAHGHPRPTLYKDAN